MKRIKDFVKRSPVLTYFIMTFAISWGGVLLVMSRMGGIPTTKEQLAAQLPIAILLVIVGPGTASLLLTSLVSGKAGYRDLLSSLLKWRVSFIWYAIALLTGPLVLLATLLALSLTSPVYLPGIFTTNDPTSRLMFGILAGLAVGFLEELGWTGFAVPRLKQRYSILATGLIIGILWGAWHIMGQVVMASGTYTGEIPLQVFLIAQTVGLLFGQLPAFRVLMVWVYDRTGSLLVAMLMHVTLTAATMIFEPLAISGAALLIYLLASNTVMWFVVGAVAVANREQLSRKPLPRMAT